MLPTNLEELLRIASARIGATESIVLCVDDDLRQPDLRLLQHIRDDGSDAYIRAQSVMAFKEIGSPCVEQARDGIIRIIDSEANGTQQYCIVKLAVKNGLVVGAAAFITRCEDEQNAHHKLETIRSGVFDDTAPMSDVGLFARAMRSLISMLQWIRDIVLRYL